MAASPLALVLAALVGADSDVARLDLREAMASGRTAFLGRVVATEEVAGPGDDSWAEAELRLVACYYGIDCVARQALRIRYLAQTPRETTHTVELAVAEEVLFVLRAPPEDPARIAFDSDPDDGLDSAYRSDKLARDERRDTLDLRSVYGGAEPVRLRYAELEGWGKARRQELEGGTPGIPSSAAGVDLDRWIESSVAMPADEAALVARLGEGCVSQVANPAGGGARIHHCYHDKASRLWIEARVDDSGPNLGRVSGFVVSSAALCDKRCSSPSPLAARSHYGVGLGDAAERVIGILGEPLRRAETKLGSTRVEAMSFAPREIDPASIAIFYLKKGAVVGWSFERND